MQDLPMSQKRDRPAYCYQHLNLELRSHDDGGQTNLPPPAPRLLPDTVVACFEPEWNSLAVNKTRSFNILGGIHRSGMPKFAAFARGSAKSPALTMHAAG